VKIIGISLRKPSFNELTAAVVMGAGLWIAAVGVLRTLLQVDLPMMDAGALLLVALWGCVSTRVGLQIGEGSRHVLANLLVAAVLLALYQGAWAVMGSPLPGQP
jgi:hypothetical protein